MINYEKIGWYGVNGPYFHIEETGNEFNGVYCFANQRWLTEREIWNAIDVKCTKLKERLDMVNGMLEKGPVPEHVHDIKRMTEKNYNIWSHKSVDYKVFDYTPIREPKPNPF